MKAAPASAAKLLAATSAEELKSSEVGGPLTEVENNQSYYVRLSKVDIVTVSPLGEAEWSTHSRAIWVRIHLMTERSPKSSFYLPTGGGITQLKRSCFTPGHLGFESRCR